MGHGFFSDFKDFNARKEAAASAIRKNKIIGKTLKKIVDKEMFL